MSLVASRKRVGLALTAAAASAALVVAASGGAHAAAPGKTAWFDQVAASPAPAAPGLATGAQLQVGGGEGQTTAISTLDFVVDPATPSATLTLPIDSMSVGLTNPVSTIGGTLGGALGSSPVGNPAGAVPAGVAPVVDACTVTKDTWTLGGDQPKSATPPFSCANPPQGIISPAGTTISFNLGAPVNGDYDIALVPDATSTPFTAVFDAPTAMALAADPGVTTPDTTPVTTPTAAAPVAGDSGSVGPSTPAATGPATAGGDGSSSQAAGPSLFAGGSGPVDSSPLTPSVGPLPGLDTGSSGAATASPVASAPAAESAGIATRPAAVPVQAAAALHPKASNDHYLVGAIGLGLLLLALMIGSTRTVRPARLLGSLSIGSLKPSEDWDPVTGTAPAPAPKRTLRDMLTPRPPRLLGSLSISSLQRSADE